MAKHNRGDLQQMQSLPLEAKIRMTEQRIQGWVESWKRWKIVNKKTGKVRYITDTEEPSEKGHWIEDEKNKKQKLVKGTKLKPFEYVDDWESEMAYVSFSGGKDSTVLLDIVRKLYPDTEAVFVNTGLEYPSVREFATNTDNVTSVRPSMTFREVLLKHGYPVISKEIAGKAEEVKKSIEKGKTDTVRYRQFMGIELKDNGEKSEYNCDHYKYLLNAPFRVSDKCCDIMKKRTVHQYEKENGKVPITAIMAEESRQRKTKWLRYGCNAWEMKHPQSNPMSFWKENDVLQYIYENNLQIAKAYGNVVLDKKKCKFNTTGSQRTGCIFCLFGITADKERIARLQIQEPKLADYVLRGGEFGEDGYWKPSKTGLGYWFVIEWLNTHGLDIKYYDYGYQKEYGTQKTTKLLLNEKIKTRMKRSEKDDSGN